MQNLLFCDLETYSDIPINCGTHRYAENAEIYVGKYSPDLNPIEHKWAQAKSKKRESGCDTDILFSRHMV